MTFEIIGHCMKSMHLPNVHILNVSEKLYLKEKGFILKHKSDLLRPLKS